MRPCSWSVVPSGALLLLASCGKGPSEPERTMEVVQVVRDLLTEPGSWETVRARDGGAPSVAVLCPSVSAETDGADMPALVVPPPGEVRIAIPAGPEPVRLVTRVGVDQLAFKALSAEVPSARFAFELRAGERVLAREVVELVHGRHKENAWVDLGGPAGVELRGPQTVTLRTSALLADGSETDPPGVVQAGFGGLRLERRLARERTRSSPEHPNVVLVVMDTLRADRLSAHGYPRPTSPRLDELARRGVLFESCYSTSSWTWPATASLLTGLWPMEHGLVGEGSSFLIEEAATLAESLQLAGCTTAAWSGNPIVSPSRNFDQGFERFWTPPGVFEKTGEFFEEVRAFLREQRGTRFFLYLHLVDPHTPLRPLDEGARALAAGVPPGFREKCDGFWHATGRGQAVKEGGELALDGIASAEEREWTSQLYDASVWSGDRWLGALLDELAALDLADETVVAFTADHGEELFERGFIGHGQSVHGELVRVPLVVAGPGVPRGERNPRPVSSRMVAPLLARLAGADFAGGEAAVRALAGSERGEDLVLFSTTKGSWKGRNHVRVAGLTDGEWKLDLALNGAPWGAQPGPEGDLELFRLSSDPGEREDLAARQPEVAARLRALLLERLETLAARRIGTDIPAGGATLHMLQQLGYAGDEH